MANIFATTNIDLISASHSTKDGARGFFHSPAIRKEAADSKRVTIVEYFIPTFQFRKSYNKKKCIFKGILIPRISWIFNLFFFQKHLVTEQCHHIWEKICPYCPTAPTNIWYSGKHFCQSSRCQIP